MKRLSSSSLSDDAGARLAEEFFRGMIAQLGLGGQALSSDMHPTETLLFYFTGNGQLSYALNYDGWIVSAQTTSGGGNFGIALNTDLPATTISSQNVFTGQNMVLWPSATGTNQIYYMRHPFKKEDVLKCRNYNAGTNGCEVVLQRNLAAG
jgi:hypothetical protein